MNKALLSGLVLLLSLSALGQAPSPKITPNTPTAGCAPLVVQLTDGSTGATSRNWDFGGVPPAVTPATSAAATQVIVYTQPGTYTVTLTATNASGSANTTTTVTVFPAPAADFTPSITTGCFPTSVSFTDNSTPGNLPGASLTYWLWDFGDGTLDSVQNPTHLYTRSGNFKVTLYVKNNFGCKGNAAVKTVDGAINLTTGIVPSFATALDANCSVPKNATFTNQTTGPGTLNYTWDFGDGSAKSNTPSPVHTYTAPGDYSVKLITTSNQGCFDTLVNKVTITANNNVTSFVAPAGVCLNVPITFSNTSNPFPGSSVWDFGDGSPKQTAFNGVHAFTTAGTYKVILTNDFQGCTGADTIAVQAVSQPTVQFTGDKLVGCQAPLTINFKDQTIGATSWLWDFGDGSAQSTIQNPQHTYANFGNYTVTLVAASMGGCSSNHTDVIKIAKPVINITSLPGNGCAPFLFTPTANVVTADGVASYHWDFGNGSTFDGANPPAQNYPNPGTYTVSLHIVTNGGCTADASGLVKVGTNKPTPDFTASPTTLCVGQPVSFQDKTTGTVNGYLWDFGDGQVVHDVQNPTHTYTAPGTYTVKMFAYDDGCGLTTPKTMDIVVKGTAGGFNYSFNCSSKTVYTFTDASNPTPDSWLWDFGDGSTSTSQNPPAHSYTAAGPTNFTVTLTATKDGCPSTISKPISVNQSTTITVNPAPPVCSNTQVLITAHVPGYVASYYYDFGDGNQSGVVKGPLYHTYLNPNSAATPFYNIVVHTTDSLGCTDASAPFQMKVSGVKASFTYSNPKYCSTSATDNLTVNFKDNSVVSPGSTIVSYDWDFGDGNKASGPSVSHTYTVENQYSVKLKVTTSDGCVDSVVYGGLVILARPTAMYTTTGVNFCQTSNIKFTNTSTSRFNPTYTWNFGDGSSYIGANPPPHVYPANGDYTVSLHVADTTGCSSDFTNPLGPIHIDMPSASFTVDQDYSTCPPLTVHFTFTGHYAQSFLWNFDDGGANSVDTPTGHIYAMPGSFNPVLTVTSPGGCTASAPAHPIKIDGPIGSMSFSPTGACDNLLVNFTVNTSNDVKFVWFFGDSTSLKPDTTTVPTNSHQYTYPGTFTPVVVLIDNAECAVPYFGSPVTDVTVESIGATNFVADKTLLCDSGTIVFKDTSLLSKGTVINTYVWDFGDGSPIVGGVNPVPHYFSGVNTYLVRLTIVTDFGCSGDTTIPIQVVASPKIGIGGFNPACEPATLTFTGIEVTPDPYGPLSWSWNFDNGQTASVQNPGPVSYPKAGSYAVKLTATNTKGCATTYPTVADSLKIYPLPNVNAGLDTTICWSNPATPFPLHATGDPAVSFTWQPPADGTVSCTACADAMATAAETTYFVVTGQSPPIGCQRNDTIKVKVNTPVTLAVGPPDSVCLGQSAQLTASGADIYSWTPNEGLSNPDIANPVATPTADQLGGALHNAITYSVTGYDDIKCFSDTKSINVTAFQYPTIDLGPDVTLPVGSSYQINGNGSPDIVSMTWSPTTSLSCINCLDPIANPIKTIDYKLTVVNDGGCVSSDGIHINVVCTNGNFFIPNTFSPNGDGVNDRFIVRGKGLNIIPSITIYNRWGQIVFEKRNFAPNDESQGWDGTFNGKPAPSDVYIYTVQILCDNATLIPYHGNVTLVR